MTLILALLLACGGTDNPAAAPAATAPPAATQDPASDPASAAAPAAAPAAAQGELDVAALKARLDAGDLAVIDVRSKQEFESGHVPGAVNIPLPDLKARMAELEPYREKEVALICAVGGRSSSATKYLQTEGFTGAINVSGGTKAWVQAGYPTE